MTSNALIRGIQQVSSRGTSTRRSDKLRHSLQIVATKIGTNVLSNSSETTDSEVSGHKITRHKICNR